MTRHPSIALHAHRSKTGDVRRRKTQSQYPEYTRHAEYLLRTQTAHALPVAEDDAHRDPGQSRLNPLACETALVSAHSHFDEPCDDGGEHCPIRVSECVVSGSSSGTVDQMSVNDHGCFVPAKHHVDVSQSAHVAQQSDQTEEIPISTLIWNAIASDQDWKSHQCTYYADTEDYDLDSHDGDRVLPYTLPFSSLHLSETKRTDESACIEAERTRRARVVTAIVFHGPAVSVLCLP